MLELTEKVVEKINKEIMSMEKKGFSYGIHTYQNIKIQGLQEIIASNAFLAEQHIEYANTSASEFLNREGKVAGYLARETLTEKVGIFYSLMKEQLNVINLHALDTADYTDDAEPDNPGEYESLNFEDAESALPALDEIIEQRYMESQEILNGINVESTNTYQIINQLVQQGVEEFEEEFYSFSILRTQGKELSQRVEMHLLNSLINLYQSIEEVVYGRKFLDFTSQSHSSPGSGAYQ